MALGIYKPGQGYWVRVLTATFAGVFLLAAAAWVYGQLEPATAMIPVAHWEMTVRNVEGTAEPGQRLAMYGEPIRVGDPRPLIGEGVVRAIEPVPAGYRVDLSDVTLQPEWHPTQAQVLRPAEDGIASLEGTVSAVRSQQLFEGMLLQGAGAMLLLLIGAILIFYYVGAKPGSAEFLIATDGEMKKVNWSTRRDVMGSTIIVIVWAFMIAAGLFVVDIGFSNFFRFIRVLE